MNTASGSKNRAKKRCVCGRSTTYPLCDGAHSAEGWACSAVAQTPVERAFLAGPHLVNLADRLAHGLGGVSVSAVSQRVRATELVVLSDGSDIPWLRTQMTTVDASNIKIVGIGMDPEVLGWAFPEFTCVAIPEDEHMVLWPAVERAVQEEDGRRAIKARPKVFVSHAVADEGRLFPVLKTLREQYGLTLFVCADSIPAGRDWQQEIRTQLTECDLFLLVSSQSVTQSTYCAFEVGMATALGKEIRVIHLEDSATPPYLSHLQGVSVPRLLVRKPWLTSDEAVLDAILDALGT